MPIPLDQQRATAARLLTAVVVHGQTSDQALARFPADPLSREMFYGTLRHYFSLRREVDAALSKPLRPKDQDIHCLLLVGAYQLRHTRIPDYAAINETVAACKVLQKTSIGRLVNGVLRTIQRQTERSFGPQNPESEFPEWMVGLLNAEFPDNSTNIHAANLERAPMTIRINQQRIAPAAYAALLDEQQIDYGPSWHTEFLTLEAPRAADTLPGFDAGLVAVQDAGAGFVARLLNCAPHARLLDACAAPGGKLFHLVECEPSLQTVAIDKSARRIDRLITEARRLGHTPSPRVADATRLDWWDGAEFDAVLIDAPCSGSGTLRRHPDIKILRTAADLAGYAQRQSELLHNLWRTLRPGGSLLYCTCSLFTAENDAVVGEFIATAEGARAQTITLPTGIAREFGWQLLPTDRRTDGFYFSLLRKAPLP